MKCDWCGKFRKEIDLFGYFMPTHDRLDAEMVVVCRWCSPSDFDKTAACGIEDFVFVTEKEGNDG